ncbi:MAG: SufS family cysteine desulfurase [Planctomycetes bacterium]|nr:SufS family cysteine desulfurase [Planctomycetota bacterium]
MRGKPLAYLDSAATSLKPRCVLDTVAEYYGPKYGTVRRGVYGLSEKATAAFEGAREKVARFLGAPGPGNIVFTKGTTEAINLVASSWGRTRVQAGDRILVTAMEHHANIVPWQLLCREKGAHLDVLPMNAAGELEMERLPGLLDRRTRLVAVAGISNALGTVNPVREIARQAHEAGALVLVDAAQMVAHARVDVADLGCDFLAFSGHKLFGPCGVGVLYGKAEILESMPPYQGGGDMIQTVTFEKTTFAEVPRRFEAGTPAIVEVIGLGTAIDYVRRLGIDAIGAHDAELLEYGTRLLEEIPGLSFTGTARRKAGILAFVLSGVHPHDIGSVLDQEGIAIRAGHHCAQPVMQFFGVAATARASLSIYNTRDDLDRLAAGLRKVVALFR